MKQAAEGRWRIPAGGEVDRVDRWLARLAGISRGEARRLLDAGGVQVRGRRCRVASRKLGPGDSLSCRYDAARVAAAVAEWQGPEPRILYRDQDIATLWKPPGVAVQATRSTVHGTLEQWLRSQPLVEYVAFHHRLDRDAQGLLVVALDRRSNKNLAAAFRERTATRRYRVLVEGEPEAEGGRWHHLQRKPGRKRIAVPWEQGAEGQEMIARWDLLERRGGSALIEVALETGRTHQVRLQCAAEGLPVRGDRLYGRRHAGGLHLQAYKLSLRHPVTGAERGWELDLPQEWMEE